MITIFHGDDVTASRAAFIHLREEMEKTRDIRFLEGKKITEQSLIQAFESSSLFGDSIAVFGEHILSLGIDKKSKLGHRYIEILRRNEKTCTAVFWEGKELSAAFTKELGAFASIKRFMIPTLVFQILDGLQPGAHATILPLVEKAQKNIVPEVFFIMLVKRIRHLIMIAGGVTPKDLAGWQCTRLTTQSKLFTMEKLTTMHKQLFDIDVAIKTGTSPFNYWTQILLFLSSI